MGNRRERYLSLEKKMKDINGEEFNGTLSDKIREYKRTTGKIPFITETVWHKVVKEWLMEDEQEA
jgi:hypothetical protein